MRYFLVFFNTVIIYFKSILKEGKWSITFFQNIDFTTKFNTQKNSEITLGKNMIIERYGNIFVGTNAFLEIGDYNYFNRDLIISCCDKVIIGSHCLFGPNVKIYDNNHKFSKDKGVSFELSSSPIIIGDNCWIASNVVILKGAKIGNNCVIGAGCIVSGVIPDNSLVKQKNNLIVEEIK